MLAAQGLSSAQLAGWGVRRTASVCALQAAPCTLGFHVNLPELFFLFSLLLVGLVVSSEIELVYGWLECSQVAQFQKLCLQFSNVVEAGCTFISLLSPSK